MSHVTVFTVAMTEMWNFYRRTINTGIMRPGPSAIFTQLRLVLCCMFLFGHKDQILWSIVRSIVIAVVDIFVLTQGSSKHLGHYKPMLKDIWPISSIRMVRLPYQSISIMKDYAAVPSRMIRSCHLPTLRWLSFNCPVSTGARAKDPSDNVAGFTSNYLAAGVTRIVLGHTHHCIPLTA